MNKKLAQEQSYNNTDSYMGIMGFSNEKRFRKLVLSFMSPNDGHNRSFFTDKNLTLVTVCTNMFKRL